MGKSSKRALEAAAAAPSSDAAPMEIDAMVTVVESETPKSKKSKKDKDEGETKEIPKEAISAIAKPLAGKKLNKHVLKLVKKGKFFGASSDELIGGEIGEIFFGRYLLGGSRTMLLTF